MSHPRHDSESIDRTGTASLTRRGFARLGGVAAAGLLSACAGNDGTGAPAAEPAEPASEPTEAATAPEVPASTRTSFFSVATLPEERTVSPSASSYSIDPGLADVASVDDVYMSDAAKAMVGEQGFAVMQSYADEFWPIYEENRYNHRPNLVTVDSMMHSYHLYFEHLLKKTEGGALSDALARMSHALLDATQAQLTSLTGTEWEDAARRAVAFFGVGCSLVDPATQVPQEVAETVSGELAAIEQAAGAQNSLVTGAPLDYSQFIVRGYYEQTETLQRYFRTMMWYGQLSFVQRDETLDRAALLMTLALDEAALDDWQAIYAVTSFFVGAADDNGYYEYLPAFEQAYGSGASVGDLAGNDEAWQAFHKLTGLMPTPQINSLPGSSARDNEEDRGFRFMGQRFTIDSYIFQKLVYDNIGATATGETRLLPCSLDIPAALGSEAAYDQLASGIGGQTPATDYAGYDENLSELKDEVAGKDDAFWQASLYNQWLHTLRPLLEEKGEGYPTFMQSASWALHSLESFLGSYTELKHDTILYAKQMMAEGDGAWPEERDDRGYVEPEPIVFDRLARLCSATTQGLAHFGLIDDQDADDLGILQDVADRLAAIAAKELANELPSDEEFELIRSVGEQLEHFWLQVHQEEAEREGLDLRPMQFPAAIVADVATGQDSCLELGTGKVSLLFAVVPVDGGLRLASGPVFTFHEFVQPTSNRLTDTEWREMVKASFGEPTEATQVEPWTSSFRASLN